jgi:competence protein ComEA
VAGHRLREWVKRNRGGVLVGAVVVGVVVAGAGLIPRPTSQVVIQQPVARASPSPADTSPLAVHVGGEVLRPGLYRLTPGSRVNDAVGAAGGPTAEADIHRVNLAARLVDGQQIVVPRKAEARASAGSPSPATAARISINTASVAELDTLPGVGPVTAQRIVAYREQHGPFASVQQLRDAKLVNASTYDRIKDLVTQ